MNSKTALEQRKYEKQLCEFLMKRIGNAGGSLPFQHISGHFSQLKPEIRSAIGTSLADLEQFLKRHRNLFFINKNNVVSLANLSAANNSEYDYDSDESNRSHSNLPPNIINGKGVVIKVLPTFGFIKSKEPIKTEIYFTPLNFGDINLDLTSFLYIGSVVHFNANREAEDKFKSKYKATKVWKADGSGPDDNPGVRKNRKTRDTGLYDPVNLDDEGIVQNVFPNMGFIAVRGDHQNTVFFHKNRVAQYDNVVDLTKIFSIGDRVEFRSIRSTKADSKARWEATKVWKVSGKMKRDVPSKSESSNQSSLSKGRPVAPEFNSREMKKDHPGKICPRSHGAVIKFDENELADGDSALYYICGTQVKEIAWEFTEGDEVHFDAVKIKSAPGWKATLVWVGKKPDVVLPTCLGDFTEFTDEENEEVCSSAYTPNSTSYVSGSSSSSLKSVSLKSDVSAPKNKDPPKQKAQKVLNFKKPNKNFDSSQESLNTLPNSKQLRKFGKKKYIGDKFINKRATSWGDSPYPDDEAYENDLTSKSYASDVPEETVNSCTIDTVVEKVDLPASESSGDVYEELNDECSNFSATENEDTSKDCLSKVPASIKQFRNTEGTVKKVYSKFAEVKSSNLKNIVSFFWSDYYCDGMSVEQLKLDDLKQVLKIGDVINFNYFIIVDDSGQSWQKVTLAWQGSKPQKVVELSPADFIKQNNLSVTISDDLLEEEDNISNRKFLTLLADDTTSTNKDVDKLSKTESYSEESLTFLQESILSDKNMPPFDLKTMSEIICKVLKKDVFSFAKEVNLSAVSEEIVNLISESCDKKKLNPECYNFLPQEKNTKSISLNVCPECKRKNANVKPADVNVKDSEAQTIVTGDIIAQNIFTEC